MAIPADIERKRDFMVEQVRGSILDPAVKEEVIQNLTSTAASTNGLKGDEKIQAISINQFDMARSDARIHLAMAAGFKRIEERLAEFKPMSRLDVIVRCKWQIVILAAIIAGMFILKPELAAYLELLRR
jgi:hypothetical protein